MRSISCHIMPLVINSLGGYTHTNVCTHAHMHALKHPHTHAHMHERTHTHTCMHTYTHMHAHTRTHTHTHTHTHIHTDDPHMINFKKPGMLAAGWCAPGLKTTNHMALKFFPGTILLLKVDCFEGILNQIKIDGMVNDHSSSYNL